MVQGDLDIPLQILTQIMLLDTVMLWETNAVFESFTTTLSIFFVKSILSPPLLRRGAAPRAAAASAVAVMFLACLCLKRAMVALGEGSTGVPLSTIAFYLEHVCKITQERPRKRR